MKFNYFKLKHKSMRKILGLLVLITTVFFSCSDDDSDLTRGKEMYITSMKLFANSSDEGEQEQQLIYDVNFKFNDINIITGVDISEGEDEKESIDLTENSPESFVQEFLDELIQDDLAVKQGDEKIIKGYEYFEIKSRDANYNVTEFTMGEGEDLVTINLEYNSKPFFLYWNLKAAGIMNAIKDIKYFGSANNQKAEMVDALIPVNNISKFTYKEKDGDTMEVILTYVYDEDGMLTAIDVKATETYIDEGKQTVDEYDFRLEIICKK